MSSPWRDRYRILWRAYSARLRSSRTDLERLRRTAADRDRLRSYVDELHEYNADALDVAEGILRQRGFVGPPLELPIDAVNALATLLPGPRSDITAPPGWILHTDGEPYPNTAAPDSHGDPMEASGWYALRQALTEQGADDPNADAWDLLMRLRTLGFDVTWTGGQSDP